jgi:hypothetical protein
MIDDLRTKRNNADYNLGKRQAGGQRTAMLVVEEADKIIDDLRACLEEPRYSELKAAIDTLRP